MMDYYKALKTRNKITSVPPGMTRDHCLESIASINEQLKKPMSNTERIILVHDREDLRDIIALLPEVSP